MIGHCWNTSILAVHYFYELIYLDLVAHYFQTLVFICFLLPPKKKIRGNIAQYVVSICRWKCKDDRFIPPGNRNIFRWSYPDRIRTTETTFDNNYASSSIKVETQGKLPNIVMMVPKVSTYLVNYLHCASLSLSFIPYKSVRAKSRLCDTITQTWYYHTDMILSRLCDTL